jgi:hypothetical protein
MRSQPTSLPSSSRPKNCSSLANQAIEPPGNRVRRRKLLGPDRRKLLRAFLCAASKEFCLRLLCNVEQIVARDIELEAYQALERLVADAKCHSDNLQDVEGLYVPVKRGVWIMDTGGWAGKVLFSIARHCGVPWIWNELAQTKYNTLSNRFVFAPFSSLNWCNGIMQHTRWTYSSACMIMESTTATNPLELIFGSH